jgi:hypothetical protein
MQLSKQQIESLQALLQKQLGLTYADEDAQVAGVAIMRFVLAKERAKHRNKSKELNSGGSEK